MIPILISRRRSSHAPPPCGPSLNGGWRFLACLLLLCLCWQAVDADAAVRRGGKRKAYRLPDITGSSRYAALVVDVRRGLVLYERGADQVRYPASLTKMMTLYLTFEAIEKGKFTLDTKLRASKVAAVQPQTNISLREGEMISVRDCIHALIVRSANDAAVVLAEGIGGSVPAFGKLMTAKAHQLGMKDTQYRNPHGLPDPAQHTTARDLVKLSLALRRHFPAYYPMFKRDTFTYKGRSYHTHNRITKYYRGADGIKTGFINASGFNLATSVRRDGHDLIAVVLGGYTGQQRDDHMRRLLDDALERLNSPSDFFRQFANQVPRPVAAKPSPDATQLAAARAPRPAEEDTFQLGSAAAPTPAPAPTAKPPVRPLEENTVPRSHYSSMLTNAKVNRVVANDLPKLNLPEGTQDLRAQLGQAQQGTPAVEETASLGPADWGIQVGTFSNAKDAIMAATNALSIASSELASSTIKVANVDKANQKLHRARLGGLTEGKARAACRVLISHNAPCFIYKEDGSS